MFLMKASIALAKMSEYYPLSWLHKNATQIIKACTSYICISWWCEFVMYCRNTPSIDAGDSNQSYSDILSDFLPYSMCYYWWMQFYSTESHPNSLWEWVMRDPSLLLFSLSWRSWLRSQCCDWPAADIAACGSWAVSLCSQAKMKHRKWSIIK